MTREKMLEILADLPFAMIWPGSWDDVGFTEREIWVNNQGYGYVLCDEPTARWEGQGVSLQEWETLKPKIVDLSLSYSDIEGTAIEEMLSSMGYDESCFDEDNECLSSLLCGLIELEDGASNYFYALQGDGEIQFFDSESAFKDAFERDWADEFWDSMSDELLSEWIDRLSIEEDDTLVQWTQKHGLPEEDVDGPQDIEETDEYKGYFTAHNTKEFTFCCSTTVYEGKKKRYVSLKAIGENKYPNKSESRPKTIFQITSTRNETIGYFVIAGICENGQQLSTDEELGKWAIVKNHMYPHLVDRIKRVVGVDPYACSLDLYHAVNEALGTPLLEQLIIETEEKP